MRRVLVLGSTGSIGVQALDVLVEGEHVGTLVHADAPALAIKEVAP